MDKGVVRILTELAVARMNFRNYTRYGVNVSQDTESYYIGLVSGFLRSADAMGAGKVANKVLDTIRDLPDEDIGENTFFRRREAKELVLDITKEA